jgi:hypothetical protein
MKRKYFLLLGVLFFSCCLAETVNKIMISWENHHYGDLIASWGPPQQVFDDGYGGRILVYTLARYWSSPATSKIYVTGNATAYDNYIWGSAAATTTYYPSQIYGYTAYRMFWINKDGYIYRWAWRGI